MFLGNDFINSYKKYQAASLIGIQDFADRLSYMHSTILFMICTTIIGTKTYILKPLACHVPTTPSGKSFSDYLESFCWVTGSVPFRANESIPEDEAAWDLISHDRKISEFHL